MNETTQSHPVEQVRIYLNSNSIVRRIISIDTLSVGDIAHYCLCDTDYDLDDVFILLRRNHSFEIMNGEDISVPDRYNNGHKKDFYGVTFNFHINNKCTEGLKELDISEKLLTQVKKEFLAKEENIFIEFVEKVAKATGQYFYCETIGESLDTIDSIDYEDMWAFDGFKDVDIYGRCRQFSPNLSGFILTHEKEPKDIGIFTIRQEVTMLPNYQDGEIVTFEDIAMSLIGKNITYIEVKK